MSHASGRYIAFADSDDIVPDNTYSKMLRLAEQNGTELTICNVERFDSAGSTASGLHERVFRDTAEVTHIAEKPDLLYDTTAWNKLIRRDFYEKNHFSFPEGIYCEDMPVTIPMHILCNKVSMMAETGYLWRRREGGPQSITQNTATMWHLEDRLTSMRLVDDFFREHVTDRTLIEAKQRKFLEADLNIFVRNCIAVPEMEALGMLTLINLYIDEAIEPEMFGRLALMHQQRYAYVRDYDLEKLKELLSYRDYETAEITESDGRLTAALPDDLFTIESRDVTDEIRRRAPAMAMDAVSCSDNEIVIGAHLYWKRVSLRSGEQEIRAYLTNKRENIDLRVEPRTDGWLTGKRGETVDRNTGRTVRYNYDGATFYIHIDLGSIPLQRLETDQYHIMIHYSNRFFEGECILKGPSRGIREKIEGLTIREGDITAEAGITQGRELSITVHR